MKGFLNKVQNKVAGAKSPTNGEGKPVEPSNPIRSEATPRADISLPRGRERRQAKLNP